MTMPAMRKTFAANPRTLVLLSLVFATAFITSLCSAVHAGDIYDAASISNKRPEADAAAKIAAGAAYGKLPLSFEANEGQTDKQVKFLSYGPGYGLFLSPTEAVLSLRAGTAGPSKKDPKPSHLLVSESQKPLMQKAAVLRMRLEHANSNAKVSGIDELAGKANYFIGNDPAKWRSNIPTFGKVKYQQVYPGVDLVYYGNQRELEYDLALAPGADPRNIKLSFDGAERLRLDTDGDLVVSIAGSEVIEHKPVIYQEIGGTRRPIAGGYELLDAHTAGFKLAGYDAHRSLTIDPSLVLVYSTYLGGSGNSDFGGDFGNGIAVDAAGDAYVTGQTTSTNFPTTAGAFQTTLTDDASAFVSKLNSSGSALVYSTYLGGVGAFGGAIALDAAGNAYVTGSTGSDFPTTAGAFQTAYPGGNLSAFISELNSSGSALVYSTYLGSNNNDSGSAIAVDAAGNAYVSGGTGCAGGAPVPCSSDFPTTPGAFQTTFNGVGEDFVSKLNSSGSALVYSTYLGGGGGGIAVDASGDAYVTGKAGSGFTTTAGAFQTTFGGGVSDAVVIELNSNGSALIYSTYLGGTGTDFGSGIAIDSAGNAYVTGTTFSSDFPTTPGAFQTTLLGSRTAFVSQLNSSGSALVYSTYLGGSNFDGGVGIAVDAAGNAYVTGSTASSDFPITPGAFQTSLSNGESAFVSELNSGGSGLVYSTYLSAYAGLGIALDAAGNAYVTGVTFFSDFSTTPGAFQTTLGTDFGNAFISKLAPSTVTYTGIFRGNLTISSGLTYITNGTVTGSVTQKGGSLFVSNSTIRGNLQTTHGGSFSIENSTVNGNVVIVNHGDLFTVNAAIGGNLQIIGGGAFSIQNTAVDGTLQIQSVAAASTENEICGTHVKGTLQFDNNATATTIGTTSASCPGNTIGGNLQVISNFDAVQVFDDTAGGNLQCLFNRSITGDDDTARLLQGQCADF